MIDMVNLAICGISESVSLFRNKQDVLQFFSSFPMVLSISAFINSTSRIK